MLKADMDIQRVQNIIIGTLIEQQKQVFQILMDQQEEIDKLKKQVETLGELFSKVD
jgi:hypothetical protein